MKFHFRIIAGIVFCILLTISLPILDMTMDTKINHCKCSKVLGTESTLQRSRPVNYDFKRTFCAMEVREGVMCPPFYTELGGECSYNGSQANCVDKRRFGTYRLRKACDYKATRHF